MLIGDLVIWSMEMWSGVPTSVAPNLISNNTDHAGLDTCRPRSTLRRMPIHLHHPIPVLLQQYFNMDNSKHKNRKDKLDVSAQESQENLR